VGIVPLRDRLAFKGGTAIKKIYEPDYRFSEDLDFTQLDDVSNQELVAAIEALFPWLRREVNLTLEVRRVETHVQTGNPAIYLNYVGPLRGDLSHLRRAALAQCRRVASSRLTLPATNCCCSL
jgi:hypothetical protein